MAELSALFAAHQIAGESQTLAGAIQGYATLAWMRATERSELVAANVSNPNLVPGANELLHCYYAGGCTLKQLQDSLRYSGIETSEDNAIQLQHVMWSKILEVQQPRPPLDVLLRADALGYPLSKPLDTLIARKGFRSLDDIATLKKDSVPLDFAVIMQLWVRGIITDEDLNKYLKHAGYRDSYILDLIKQESLPVDEKDALILLNRGIITGDDLARYQKWAGFRDDDVRKKMSELRWTWPVLSQYIQWGSIGALDDKYVADIGLDEEQPPGLFEIARANGQHWTGDDSPPQGWPYPDTSPAELAWRAHWRPNDLPTAIEMLHRLRPTGGMAGGPRVPGVSPYTVADLDRDLAANLVPPGRRDQIKAVTYSLPRYTIYRTALAAGVITPEEALERYQDSGYSPDTAKLLVETAQHQQQQLQVQKLRPISLQQIKEAYRLGTITRDSAAIGLQIIYLSDYANIQQYLGIDVTAQRDLALGNPWVQLALVSIDADIAGELAKQAIEVIRKAFLRLEIDGAAALSQLSQLGIVFTRAQQYVQLWTYEHAAQGLEATAGMLRDWYLNHLIDQPTYTTRLQLLGYGLGDTQMIVARANLDLSERAAKLQAQSVKAQQLQAKQLAAALKASQAQSKAIHKAMCASGTRNQVAMWTIKGFISYNDGYQRLIDCGMTSDDAVNLLADKQPKKGGLTLEQIQEALTSKPETNGSIATSPIAGK